MPYNHWNFNTKISQYVVTGTDSLIENHADQSLDYDEELIRFLVEKATIFENNVVVRFKSGIEVEV